MTRKSTELWVLPFVIAGGCVDLGLLDELIPFDAGRGELGEGDGTDADSDTDSGGPPATDADDTAAPALAPISCASGEDDRGGFCVALGNGAAAIRLKTDEPAAVTLTAPDGARAEVVSDPWAVEHLVVAGGLPPSTEAALAISLADVNDNSAEQTLAVTACDGPTVAITEVLADPWGAEPAQEFVEIANYGAAAIDLAGWMIDDNGDENGDLLPAGCLIAPGQVALLVAPDYDPESAEDPAPASGALVVYLESSIGTGGLKNDEAETVELYDASGALVSVYDGRVGKPVEGKSAARIRAEAPDGCPRAFGEAAIDPPNPGEAQFVP
jgi:hypothetical protein